MRTTGSRSSHRKGQPWSGKGARRWRPPSVAVYEAEYAVEERHLRPCPEPGEGGGSSIGLDAGNPAARAHFASLHRHGSKGRNVDIFV